jgi:NarL family two-component system sensor histidine kinase YdfH
MTRKINRINNGEVIMKIEDKKIKNISAMELPIIGGVLIAYTATVFFQNVHNWNIQSILGFSIVIALHITMYIMREQIFKSNLFLYFFVQGILIFTLSLIIKENYQAAYLGLIPLILSQSIQLLKDGKKIFYAVLYYYTIYISTICLYKGYANLLYSISLLLLITSAVSTYGYFYTRQIRAYEKSQRLLFELEATYDKLEETTREKERQKLARDIHDTLSQGLVAVLLKLEVLEINLEKENIEKSKEITQNATCQVRDNLKEAREIIQDLRLQHEESRNLGSSIQEEIERFKADTNAEVLINWNGNIDVSPIIYKNVSFIVREILTNIKKHAKASRVIINISLEPEKIAIRIEDNGIGFDYFHFNRLYGHYGIIGLKERAKMIRGDLWIESHKKKGTCVTLVAPVIDSNKGVLDEED